jgi:hypothetical protein
MTASTTLAVAAFVVSIIALFRERLSLRIFGPRLRLFFDQVYGADFNSTIILFSNRQSGAILAQIPCWYARLRVRNVGRSTAEMVELSVTQLYRRDLSGTYLRDNAFLPLNLKWAHTGKTARDRIPPRAEKYCDLFHIVKPGSPPAPSTMAAELDLEVQPSIGTGILQPGFYRLVVEAAATNAHARTFTIDLSLPSVWADDAAGMIQNGFYLSGLPERND